METIKNYPKYAIDKQGIVWNLKFNKPLKPDSKRGKYLSVGLYKDNKHKSTLYIHRLVARTFLPNPQKRHEVNHKSGIKSDNRLKNLEWVTRKQNMLHARRNGLFTNRKLNKYQVRKIRRTEGLNRMELAKMYGVSDTAISNVLKRRTYKEI